MFAAAAAWAVAGAVGCWISTSKHRKLGQSRSGASSADRPQAAGQTSSNFSLATTQRDLGGSGSSSVSCSREGQTLYESESAVAEYLRFHFGTVSSPMRSALGDSASSLLSDAPTRVARRCAALLSQAREPKSLPSGMVDEETLMTLISDSHDEQLTVKDRAMAMKMVKQHMKAAESYRETPTATPDRALDVGCAVGGMTFALATHFKEVVGVDTSVSFVRTAENLLQQDLEYPCKTEGDAATYRVAPWNLDESVRERCRFHHIEPDAGRLLVPSDLPADLLGEGFDLVLGCNLLCRLESPRTWLEALP